MSAAIDLAIMFPPQRGLCGASTNLQDAEIFFLYGGAFPSKYTAVHLITRRNMERAIAHGKGNRAARRAKKHS